MVEGLADRHIQASANGWMLDRTDLPRELLRRLLLRLLQRAAPDMAPPRGETLDRAIAVAASGGRCSIGDWLLRGGPRWTVEPAPPRR
jgi:tRNA(Ile)-lysidine synthase